MQEHDSVVKSMNESYIELEKKYNDTKLQVNSKIDIKTYDLEIAKKDQELNELDQAKANEINNLASANKILMQRLDSLKTDNDRCTSELKSIAADDNPATYRIAFLEKELAEANSKLKANEKIIQEIGDNEAIYRRVLSQIIRVSERTAIDRDCLAVIIRQQRVKQNSLRDPLSYRHFITEDVDLVNNLLGLETVGVSDYGKIDFECRSCKRFKMDQEKVGCLSV